MRCIITGIITLILTAILPPLQEREVYSHSQPENPPAGSSCRGFSPGFSPSDFRWEEIYPAMFRHFYTFGFQGPVDTQSFAIVEN